MDYIIVAYFILTHSVVYIIIKTASEFRNVSVTDVGAAGWAWSLHGKQT